MGKWFRNALVFAALIVSLGVALTSIRKSPDPVYQGKSLSEWLQKYADGLAPPFKSHPPDFANGIVEWESDAAVRAMGTNAIPRLLRMIAAEDSALKPKLINLAQKQHWIKISYLPATTRNWEAAEGFRALGAGASNAVPTLLKLYSSRHSGDSKRAIVAALGGIGPPARDAVPFLLQITTATNGPAWQWAIWALSGIHSHPETVVPFLETYVLATNTDCRFFAIEGLGNFGAAARASTPLLVDLMSDSDWDAGVMALYSLCQIYARPEWANDFRWAVVRNPRLTPSMMNSFAKVPRVFRLSPVFSEGERKMAKIARLVIVIKGFGALGTNAAPAIPALIKFLAHDNEEVRRSTTNAFKAISPDGAAVRVPKQGQDAPLPNSNWPANP